MKKNFEAATMLLTGVWYATDHINKDTEEIDWDKIRETEGKINRSTSEEIMVEQAHDLYFFRGICDKLSALDRFNQRKYIEALNIIIREE